MPIVSLTNVSKAYPSRVPGDAEIIAVGNIDNDDYLDVWTVNRAGVVKQLQDDVRDSAPNE